MTQPTAPVPSRIGAEQRRAWPPAWWYRAGRRAWLGFVNAVSRRSRPHHAVPQRSHVGPSVPPVRRSCRAAGSPRCCRSSVTATPLYKRPSAIHSLAGVLLGDRRVAHEIVLRIDDPAREALLLQSTRVSANAAARNRDVLQSA